MGLEDLLFYTVILSFAWLLIAWITFGLTSMRCIEAKVRAEGRDRNGCHIAIMAPYIVAASRIPGYLRAL